MRVLSQIYLALAYSFVFLPVFVLLVFSFQDGRLPVPPMPWCRCGCRGRS